LQGALRAAHQGAAGLGALVHGAGQGVESFAVFAHRLACGVQLPGIDIAAFQALLDQLQHLRAVLLDLLGLTAVAAQLELQAREVGLLAEVVELGDGCQLLTAPGLVVQAAQAAEQHQQREKEEDAEAHHQLQADVQASQLYY